ncbi:MAG: hypothetical protein IKN72_03050 [Clostridia bacterium]|nr:hypothetical protein [Clostridia bacterium]
MLFFKPTTVGSDTVTVRFDALDGDICLGSCDLLIHDGAADVTQLSAEDAETGEGLLRAALNYAANRGVYMAVCTAKDADAFTSLLPFEDRGGVLTNDIPTLLTGCCGG